MLSMCDGLCVWHGFLYQNVGVRGCAVLRIGACASTHDEQQGMQAQGQTDQQLSSSASASCTQPWLVLELLVGGLCP